MAATDGTDDDRSLSSRLEEEEEVDSEFRAMDTDGDGLVTKKEYQEYRGKVSKRKGRAKVEEELERQSSSVCRGVELVQAQDAALNSTPRLLQRKGAQHP